jgi:hypothetical protein
MTAPRVWDAHTLKALSDPLAHEQGLLYADFSADGQRVLAVSTEGILRIWDVRTAQPLSEPITGSKVVSRAQFSPDGQHIYAVFPNGVWTWSLPPVPSAAEPWLIELAEAMAGKSLDEQKVPTPVPIKKLMEIKAGLEQRPASNACTRWAKWILADRGTRAMSPGSSTTLDQYVSHLIEEDTLEGVEKAVSLAPANALAWAWLGIATLMRPDGGDMGGFITLPRGGTIVMHAGGFAKNDLARIAEAERYAERALSLSPTVTTQVKTDVGARGNGA